MKARESGVEGNLIKKWMGAIINNEGMVGNAVLGAPQLILVFVGILVAFFTSFVILCIELVTSMMKQPDYKLNRPDSSGSNQYHDTRRSATDDARIRNHQVCKYCQGSGKK
jgi:hypothetical protein